MYIEPYQKQIDKNNNFIVFIVRLVLKIANMAYNIMKTA